MTAAELGLLLLRCRLKDGERPLTHAQFVRLQARVRAAKRHDPRGELTREILLELGCGAEEAENILYLLGRQAAMREKLQHWQAQGIGVTTRLSDAYPQVYLQRLGDDAPAVIFYRGDLSILQRPTIALVGSRDLREENARFAEAVGRFAAARGLLLLSGGARGADRTAQEACLACGGSVAVWTAERLGSKMPQRGLLWLSEENPDMGFSAQRALARNRLIHAGGSCTFVAQSGMGGGTWSGTTHNLQRGLSPVCLFDDGSEAARALLAMGAKAVTAATLADTQIGV